MIIFDQMGNVLNKFGCSKHLEFPNGVVVNDKQEIYIQFWECKNQFILGPNPVKHFSINPIYLSLARRANWDIKVAEMSALINLFCPCSLSV